MWHAGEVTILGVHQHVQNLARDAILVDRWACSRWSPRSKALRKDNGFTWFPIQEVAYLFAGIFMTIIPALAILKAGEHGAMASLMRAVRRAVALLLGHRQPVVVPRQRPDLPDLPHHRPGPALPGHGRAARWCTSSSPTRRDYLVAISLGAVFMGAITYIGNAPNFMVKSIAEESGIEMPSFFGYMLALLAAGPDPDLHPGDLPADLRGYAMAQAVFVELEIEGSSDRAIGFVEGFRLARPDTGPIWLSGRETLEADGLLDSLRERVGLHTRVVGREGLIEELAAALDGARDLGLTVGTRHRIDYAELEFEFRCFDREDGAAVRRVIEQDLPEDVRLEGYDVTEKVSEDAVGVELYSPVHDYVVAAHGRYVGRVDGVIALAHRLADQDFIHPKKIRLHHVT